MQYDVFLWNYSFRETNILFFPVLVLSRLLSNIRNDIFLVVVDLDLVKERERGCSLVISRSLLSILSLSWHSRMTHAASGSRHVTRVRRMEAHNARVARRTRSSDRCRCRCGTSNRYSSRRRCPLGGNLPCFSSSTFHLMSRVRQIPLIPRRAFGMKWFRNVTLLCREKSYCLL